MMTAEDRAIAKLDAEIDRLFEGGRARSRQLDYYYRKMATLTPEERKEIHRKKAREARAKHPERIRNYNRKWMRQYREGKQQEVAA